MEYVIRSNSMIVRGLEPSLYYNQAISCNSESLRARFLSMVENRGIGSNRKMRGKFIYKNYSANFHRKILPWAGRLSFRL